MVAGANSCNGYGRLSLEYLWIPNEIPIKNLNWNSHGCRSKHFGSAHRSAPATALPI